MRRLVLYAAMAFIAGLFASGQALGAGQSPSSSGTTGVGVERQHPSVTGSGVEGLSAGQLNEEQVRELQMLLRDEGYYAGIISGEYDVETRDALSEFQSAEGLAATGIPDENTLRALAPSSEQQEFFGLSPEFGEEEGVEREIPEESPVEERRLDDIPSIETVPER